MTVVNFNKRDDDDGLNIKYDKAGMFDMERRWSDRVIYLV